MPMLPVYTVTQFLQNINEIILGTFTVEGEVSGFKVSQGKWLFFDLKDESSLVSCFGVAFKIRAPLEDGMKIRVTGYPKIREVSGRFSLNVEAVELVGDGSLKRAYEMLKNKLSAEGLFSPDRKRALPYLPQKIGVIASRDSAAFGDFVRILNNRWGGVDICLRHTAVQGESAIGEICEAFQKFNDDAEGCELIVMIRGGGSMEDLAAFNSEAVARAVYGSKLPVVCGVGHERDESLADLAADCRASTPSNAAEIVVPEKNDFISSVQMELESMRDNLAHEITRRRHGVEEKLRLMGAGLSAPLSRGRMLLERFGNIPVRLKNICGQQMTFVLGAERLFKNVDPRQVLRRGFAIARDARGRVLRRAEQVSAGERFMVELAEGEITGTKN